MTDEVQLDLSPTGEGPILAVDVGSTQTRAVLLDLVEEQTSHPPSYRFLGAGASRTTVGAPFFQAGLGVNQALEWLEAGTGGLVRPLDLTAPKLPEAVGSLSVTLSAGPGLKILLVGLSELSLQGLRRVASSLYPGRIEEFGLYDERKLDQQVRLVLDFRPDLILAAGGTEKGASAALMRQLKLIGSILTLLPENDRPEVLFVGNSAARQEIEAALASRVTLHFAENILPASENSQEDAVFNQAGDVLVRQRLRTMPGLDQLERLASTPIVPSAHAFGRIIRFLSQTHPSMKGILGIDLSAAVATAAAAFSGHLALEVCPQLGLAQLFTGFQEPLSELALQRIMRWANLPLSPPLVRAYLANRAMFPGSLAYTAEEMAIEQALARIAMQQLVEKISPHFPAGLSTPRKGLLPWFEPILASGEIFAQPASLGQALLMLLDGLQPTGITTLILDTHQLAPSLGAIAATHPAAAIQVLESSAFCHLGSVVTPVGKAQAGTPILRVRVEPEEAENTAHAEAYSIDLLQGSLEVLPLPIGQVSRLHLQPLQKFDVGMGGPGASGSLRVIGGLLGVVLDGRGRPYLPIEDPYQRSELAQQWLGKLGGG